MLQRAMTVGGGGGIQHVECAGAASNSYANLVVISNDGTFTLGNWSNFSVTILKPCTVIKRINSQSQQTPYTANVGDVISIMSGSSGGNVMLIEE